MALEFDYRQDKELCRNRCYVISPESIQTVKDCSYWDTRAVEDIADLEEAIEQLKEYRRMVAARAAKLATDNYHLCLSLKRERRTSWSGPDRIYYHVRLDKVFSDKSVNPQPVIKETFPGAERHKARSRFESLRKEYPGVETLIDIAKSRWER